MAAHIGRPFCRPFLLQAYDIGTVQRPTPVLQCSVREKGSRRVKRPQEAKEKEKWTARVKTESLRRKPHNFSNWVSRAPNDDVWLRMHYPRPLYTVHEAIRMHRELAAPEMLDNSDGLLSLNMRLDMSTKKKTKFLRVASTTVRVPHFFEDGQTQKILAFCRNEEEVLQTKEIGAEFAGCEDVVKAVQKGDLIPDQFDVAVCSTELLPDIVHLRGILKDKFPAKISGALQPSVLDAVDFFRFGKKFTSKRLVESEHELQFAFGQMNQSDEQLLANCAEMLRALSALRPASLGQFVSSCMCLAPPSSERFGLHLRDMPVIPLKTSDPSAATDAAEDSDDEPVPLAEKV